MNNNGGQHVPLLLTSENSRWMTQARLRPFFEKNVYLLKVERDKNNVCLFVSLEIGRRAPSRYARAFFLGLPEKFNLQTNLGFPRTVNFWKLGRGCLSGTGER
uniref:Sex-determining region Y protein n=1 Tax=Lygus hesperus TaxID=30085 RepID=A0A0A9WN36_LYGHE